MGEASYIQGIFLDHIFFNEDNGFSIGTVLITEHSCEEERLKKAYKTVDDKVVEYNWLLPSIPHPLLIHTTLSIFKRRLNATST